MHAAAPLCSRQYPQLCAEDRDTMARDSACVVPVQRVQRMTLGRVLQSGQPPHSGKRNDRGQGGDALYGPKLPASIVAYRLQSYDARFAREIFVRCGFDHEPSGRCMEPLCPCVRDAKFSS